MTANTQLTATKTAPSKADSALKSKAPVIAALAALAFFVLGPCSVVIAACGALGWTVANRINRRA